MKDRTSFAAPAAVAQVMRTYGGLWGICGGWGIDLWLGRVTREHSDVDVSVLRRDSAAVRDHLRSLGWELEQVRVGATMAWPSSESLDDSTFNAFCRKPSAQPDFIELLFETVDGDEIVYRRDPITRLDVSRAYQLVSPGVPVLAPELVILYMAKYRTPILDEIFREVASRLDPNARRWLRDALPRSHPDCAWSSAMLTGP